MPIRESKAAEKATLGATIGIFSSNNQTIMTAFR